MHSPLIRLNNLIFSLSKGIDLVSSGILHHHKNVAIMSLKLGRIIGLEKKEIERLFVSAMLHDIGVVSQKERRLIEGCDSPELYTHACEGYRILSAIPAFNDIATVIRHHHDRWDGKNRIGTKGYEIPIASQIIFLVDRVDVLFKDKSFSHGEISAIKDKIKENSGRLFNKELVNIFLDLSDSKAFWLDLIDDFSDELLKDISPEIYTYSLDVIVDLCYAMAYVVDRKSPFTSKHSQRVATVARELSRLTGLSPSEQRQMFLAGLLHDIGKLAVPENILNKAGPLNETEMDIMMTHTYYTYHILKHIQEFPKIEEWAGFHHEKLNGKGYPFRIDKEDMSLGARIMAVSDIFTALSEDRPYRKGMDEAKLIQIMQQMTANNEIDPDITTLLLDNYNEFHDIVMSIEEFYSIAEKRKKELSDTIIKIDPWEKVRTISQKIGD